MTVSEVKELYDYDFTEVEVYVPKSIDNNYPVIFTADNCIQIDNYEDDEEVGLYQLMDEAAYNQYLKTGCVKHIDFENYYGYKDAKVLCVMLK